MDEAKENCIYFMTLIWEYELKEIMEYYRKFVLVQLTNFRLNYDFKNNKNRIK